MKLSANLGYLWPDLEVLEAIQAAKEAGFEGVEFHWPYVTHALDVALAAEATGLAIVSLNTVGGDLARGDFGLAALPGRSDEARASVDKALAYAADVAAQHVHVLAGKASGAAAERAYLDTLGYAAERSATYGIGILIEPMNPVDAPGYYLDDIETAVRTIREVGSPQVRLLFDCYHIARIHGDVEPSIAAYGDLIGHVQIASVPDRNEPDTGSVDYAQVFSALDRIGYTGFIGAEYRPKSTTDRGLAWMRMLADSVS